MGIALYMSSTYTQVNTVHEKFQCRSPSKFLRLIIIDSKLAPFISGLFDFTWHCDWDCVNLELISPRLKYSFEPP